MTEKLDVSVMYLCRGAEYSKMCSSHSELIGGVTDKRGVRPTIAREGSKLDFVRRGPYSTTKIVLFFQLLSMSRVSL
jgi:hypothetical protein